MRDILEKRLLESALQRGFTVDQQYKKEMKLSPNPAHRFCALQA
jgi:hypothetical protein